ncbi:MAG: PAS domain-containing protein [Candidatus Limnocylindrales bacterium]
MSTRLMCFPANDETFCDLASRAMVRAGHGATPAGLAEVLRPTFPGVVVRAQDPSAALGFEARWYAYRDGRLVTRSSETWWDDDSLPRVVIDETNRYTEANDAACALFGIPAGTLVGRSWEEFASQAAVVAAEDLRQSLQSLGHGDSTFHLTRPDGSSFDIDYHTVVYVSGASVLYETVLRERPDSG